MSSAKGALLAVVPGENGDPVLRYAKLNGRRIQQVSDGSVDGVTGSVRASVFTSSSYFEQTDLQAAAPKLLPLAARRHLDAELVFDESYRLRTRVLAKRERALSADIVAMSERELEVALDLMPFGRLPCLQTVPTELAIAALVREVTKELVIVFWEKGGELLSLLVGDGQVKARTRERVSDANRDVIMGRAENSLRATAARLGGANATFLVVYSGDLRALGLKSDDAAARALDKKLCKLYKPGRGQPDDAVLRDPELFGLLHVDKQWNFLDKNYQEQVNAWRFARPAAGLAGLVGLLFLGYGTIQYFQSGHVAGQFDAQRTKLQGILADINHILPSQQAMATARSGLQVQVASLSQIRLDRLLDWLTHLVPNGVVIRSLDVAPFTPAPGGYRRKRTYAPGQKPFEVKMQIMLADNTFNAAEASSAELVKRLSQRLDIKSSRLDVPAVDPGAPRNIVLVVDAMAKAVNF